MSNNRVLDQIINLNQNIQDNSILIKKETLVKSNSKTRNGIIPEKRRGRTKNLPAEELEVETNNQSPPQSQPVVEQATPQEGREHMVPARA
jgi:hypothetical protein